MKKQRQVLGVKTDIEDLKLQIAPIAEKYGLESVYLFGSRARGDASAGSDYDFYVERGSLKGIFALSGLFLDLRDVLGTEVDIVLKPCGGQQLDAYLQRGIEKDGVRLYGE